MVAWRATACGWSLGLAFLRERVDSYVFQDRSVIAIVEDVFADYAESGALAAWRWDLEDTAVYPVRSLTTQYQESDFAFVERLLAAKPFENRSEAQQVEAQVKRLPAAHKRFLAAEWSKEHPVDERAQEALALGQG